MASAYKCNWNYGNAIHDTNRILGLVSLKSGDVSAAANYLLKSGKTTGSPQLDTFGPDLDLADELLQRGKSDIVSAYLEDVKSFWEMDGGQVDGWLVEIDKGGKPRLDRFSGRESGALELFVFWFAVVWPLVVSAGFLFVRSRRINKKVLFAVVASISGCAAMFLGELIVLYGLYAVGVSMGSLGSSAVFFLIYVPLGVALLMPLLVIFLLARVFSKNTQPSV